MKPIRTTIFLIFINLN